ncbi:MAG: hypothetical protein ACOX2K_07000 [Bacillota bacterium]|jgi:hypothetical protein
MSSSSSITVDLAEQIISFVPTYTEIGDATELWLRNGEKEVDPRSIRSCLRAFWRHYSFDWQSYRQEYGEKLNRKHLLPWSVDVWRTFAPAKLRIPRVPRDPAYGYFAVEEVQSITLAAPGAAATSLLRFQDGRTLPVHLTMEELHRSLQAAAYAYHLYWGRRMELRPTWMR